MSGKTPQTFQDIIRIIGRGKKLQRNLTREEAQIAMNLLLSGEASSAQIGAFLITMRVKEETIDELAGFLEAIRQHIRPFVNEPIDGLVDLALPYDGKARNLQTGVAAALVLAAAGVPILLHGADNIPTKAGAAVPNTLRALGYPVDLQPEIVWENVRQYRFGVLNTSNILPTWGALTPIRHEFGLRTLLNTVEKLINPANADIHISGFYHASYLNRLTPILPGNTSNWIIQGDEGSVDIRPGKKTRIYRALDGQMQEIMIDAAALGYEEEQPLAIAPKPILHALILTQALQGEKGAAYNQIALTAGILLWMTGRCSNQQEGITLAKDVLDTGSAYQLLTEHRHSVY